MADQTVQTLCRMCGDHCGINVHLKDGKIVDITGNSNHPFNKGAICIKAKAGKELVYAEDRILKPLKRIGNDWQEISLTQALDEIAARIMQIKNKYGARSIGVWKGEAVGFAQQEQIVRRFAHAFGTPNYFSNDSACFVGRWAGYALVCGKWPKPDFANAKCIVLWGSNPATSHPTFMRSILAAKKKGAKLITVDCRASQVANQSDIFLKIKPGTDGALALGIARGLIAGGLIDKEYIAKYTIGFDQYKEYVAQFTAKFVENETGIMIEELNNVVEVIGHSAPQVVNYVGTGLEHQENGTNSIRAVACIDGLLGTFDVQGGNLMPEELNIRNITLYDEIPLGHLKPIGTDKFPLLYDLRKECHTMTLMDTILTGKPYPLKGIVMTATNPVLTNPNSGKVRQALKSLDLLVVRELFMTDTAELADYVLPAASYLERTELCCHSEHQIIGLTKRVVNFPECQDEYQFWHHLAHRLGCGEYFPWNCEEELNSWLLEPTGISVEELAKHPAGYKYCDIKYCKWKEKAQKGLKPFNTPSGKIEFVSQYLKAARVSTILPEYQPPGYKLNPDERYPYILLSGARKLPYTHSRNRNIKSLHRIIPDPEIEIHPQDAGNLKISSGDMVKVSSPKGSIDISVKIVNNEEIVQGVVQITHGWKNSNVNVLTHDDINDPISGFPLLKSVPVSIEKITKAKEKLR